MTTRFQHARGLPPADYMPMMPLPADCAEHGGSGEEKTCTWCIIRKIDIAEGGALTQRA
jgi:hypothetical protein